MKVTPQNIGAIVDHHLGDGRSADMIVAWLAKRGVPQQHAVAAVEKAVARRQVDGMRRRAMRNANIRIGLGGLFLLVGIIVTAVTYVVADVGETYVVMWGLIVVGVITVVQGLWARSRVDRASRKVMADLA